MWSLLGGLYNEVPCPGDGVPMQHSTVKPNVILGNGNVMGSRLLSYRKNMWLRTMCCLQISWQENRKFQQRSWSATFPHREDMVQAGCD